ncbi:MAG: hypothetical protein ACK5LN_09015 [Propioniciclava sp.]
MTPALVIPILETLTPWPEVAPPTVVELLGVILGIPLAITAVVAFMVLGPAWFRGNTPPDAPTHD